MNALSMVLKKDGAQLKRRRDGSNNAIVFIAPRAQNFLSRPNKTAVTHSLSELSPAATYVLAQRHQQQQQRKQQTKPEQSRPQEQQQSQENDKDKEEKEKEKEKAKEKGKEKGKEEKKERDKKGKIEETTKSQSPPSRRRLTLDVSERWEGDIKNATEVQPKPIPL